MQGDFSQTLDSQGRLINIKDPLREGACNAVSGGPGCFPGNIIPANRINSNGRALLNMLPRANNFDRTFTQGQFNYSTQENADNPKMNNVVRVDWRPTSNDSLYFTFKDWYSDQRGSEITAGPNKWGFFNTHYLNTDRGVSANYAKIHPRQPRPRLGLRHAPADRAVLPVDRRRLGADQPRQRRVHARPVPPGAEPAQRGPQGELQRAQQRRTSRSTTGWSIRAKRG